jgi:hypothetical protein
MAGITHRRRLFLIGIYAFLPTALVVLMLLGWMISTEKATVVLQAVDSPGGLYRAEVVREDPGVSSTYEYMVRVMPSGLTTLRKSLHVLPFAPVYIALSVCHEPDRMVVVWSGPKELTIHCEGCGTIKPGKEEWREIALRYELR